MIMILSVIFIPVKQAWYQKEGINSEKNGGGK